MKGIARLIHESNYTHQQIADILKVKKITVDKWCSLKSKNYPSLINAVMLSKLLKCEIEEIYE